MPGSETILSIFVASPGDVSEERDRLDRVVDEINTALARREGVRLELLKWERDTSPSFGTDAQAVINDQIPTFDVFVGILWHTIGSPTKRVESGTIEEFELAKARYDKDPNSVRLMLYFKDAAPLSLKDIDPEQYKRVVDFRSRVSEAGALYFEFSTVDDFANQVRIHLTKHLLDWREDHKEGMKAGHGQMVNVSESGDCGNDRYSTYDLDDDGILELEEAFEEEMGALTAVLGRMGEAIAEVGSSANERANATIAVPSRKKRQERDRRSGKTKFTSRRKAGFERRFYRHE